MPIHEVSMIDPEEEHTSKIDDSIISNIDINNDDEDENDDDDKLFESIKTSNNSKKEKPFMDWEKYDCGGVICHGTIECKPDDCKCASNETKNKNFPMLHSLCTTMLAILQPHRSNDEQSWTDFQQMYFYGRENEIPTGFRSDLLRRERELGKFLRNQWNYAKRISLKFVDDPKTPFIQACEKVIEDKNMYEKEVSRVLYSLKC